VADPFLLAHVVAPLFFDIGGALSPVSIRDQMIRGRMIVDRAVAERLIDREHRSLLVIGAGAAGATAAIRAARHGVRTWLIDIAPRPFSRQSSCSTRWVDPTHYDWPVTHWPQGYYPWIPPSMPLPWGANLANNLARLWTVQLGWALRRYPGLLTVRYRTRVNSVGPVLPGGIQVVLGTPPHGAPVIGTYTFGMVVSCAGFGTEKCTVGSYSGFRFWDTDPFEQPNLGLPPSQHLRVLISGGGDGALQDYLRIFTRMPAGKLYEQLIVNSVLKPVLVEVEPLVHGAEDQAQRAYIWGSPNTNHHDHELHRVLHGAHEKAVDRIHRETGAWKEVCNIFDGIVSSVFGKDDAIPDVELIYSCEHFSRCYALNHFLVLLVAKYLQEQHGKQTLRGYTKVTDVTGTTHTCKKNPVLCHKEEHTITFERADCFRSGGNPSQKDYNVVTIRHGVQPPPLWSGGRPIAQPRQTLPYHAAV